MGILDFITGKKKDDKIKFKENNYKNENVCFICGEKVNNKKAVPIKDDIIIKGIKKVKEKTGKVKNNKLYVCEDCWDVYKKERKSFINGIFISSLFVGIIFTLLVLGPIFLGSFNLGAVINLTIVCLVLWGFLMVIQMYKYRPATEYELGENQKTKSKPKKRTSRKRKPVKKKN